MKQYCQAVFKIRQEMFELQPVNILLVAGLFSHVLLGGSFHSVNQKHDLFLSHACLLCASGITSPYILGRGFPSWIHFLFQFQPLTAHTCTFLKHPSMQWLFQSHCQDENSFSFAFPSYHFAYLSSVLGSCFIPSVIQRRKDLLSWLIYLYRILTKWEEDGLIFLTWSWPRRCLLGCPSFNQVWGYATRKRGLWRAYIFIGCQIEK